MRLRDLVFTLGLAALSTSGVRAGGDVDFFEKKIRPVFVEHCYQCHSSQARKLRGELRLDTLAGIRKGGESGPLFVPGKPKESLLVKVLRHEDTAMPPNGKLHERVLEDVVSWIERGAALPKDFHATLLHLMGLDHEKLTYRYSGRDFRLTDVHGNVVKDIMA
jgi:hypothetical protein